jgi:hypothetical protein
VPRLEFAERGVPHGEPGHNVVHDARCLSICKACGYGLLESYSHDCWSHDDPWDMWWWWLVDPASVAVITRWAASNPTYAQEDPTKGLSAGHAHRPGARELAVPVTASLEAGKLVLSRTEETVEMRPLPVHPYTPPREVTYYVAGERPLKKLITASGGLMVLKMNWQDGTFEHGLEYLHNIMHSHETEQVSEDEFIDRVEAHRATLSHPAGALQALYLLSRVTPASALLHELRRQTYALFQDAHPDPSFP